MRKIYIAAICILAIFVVVIGSLYYNKHAKLQDAKSEMAFRLIAWNLVQLEGAIMYQMDNQWSDPNSVIEKVEDIIEGISVTRMLSKDLNMLTKKEDETLTQLLSFFERFPDYTGFPNSTLDVSDIEMFEQLRKNLRDTGWGLHISYSAGWSEFMDMANKLISTRWIGSG